MKRIVTDNRPSASIEGAVYIDENTSSLVVREGNTLRSIGGSGDQGGLVLSNDGTVGEPITFTKSAETPVDVVSEFVVLKRNNNGPLFNDLGDDEENFLWSLGWDFSDLNERRWDTLGETLDYQIGQRIIGAPLVMWDVLANVYWRFEFHVWGASNSGTVSYTRKRIDPQQVVGITFSDGTKLLSANRSHSHAHPEMSTWATFEVSGHLVGTYGYDEIEVPNLVVISASGDTVVVQVPDESADAMDRFVNSVGLTIQDFSYERMTGGGWGYNTQSITVTNNGEGVFTVAVEGATFFVGSGDIIKMTLIVENTNPMIWFDFDDQQIRRITNRRDARGAIIEFHAYIFGRGTVIGSLIVSRDDGLRVIETKSFNGDNWFNEHADITFGATATSTRIGFEVTPKPDGEAQGHTFSLQVRVQWKATIFYGGEYYD